MNLKEEKGYRLTMGEESWKARFTWFSCMGHRMEERSYTQTSHAAPQGHPLEAFLPVNPRGPGSPANKGAEEHR